MVVRQRRSIPAISLAFATLITLLALPLSGPAFGQGAGQQGPMSSQAALPGPSDDLLAKLEGIYKDIHANPELAMQERRTAGIAANWLREQGYEVAEGVGGTGVVGLLRKWRGSNGPAAGGHGCPPYEGEHRPALREHQDHHRPVGAEGSGRTQLRT
jgi:hypothetical protein